MHANPKMQALSYRQPEFVLIAWLALLAVCFECAPRAAMAAML